jgi:hypothetical protein
VKNFLLLCFLPFLVAASIAASIAVSGCRLAGLNPFVVCCWYDMELEF